MTTVLSISTDDGDYAKTLDEVVSTDFIKVPIHLHVRMPGQYTDVLRLAFDL